MKAKQFFFAGTHPAGVEPPREAVKVDDQLMQQLKARAAKLPIEGELASFAGATGWLNSDPSSPADLRGKVVLVDFWTFTCVNWLRTFPYVRAWAEKYGDKGLVVIGVHTPEFPFEGDFESVRKQAKALGVDYPIAVDTNYGVWRAFDNNYWPALYLADAQGRIRAHHFGEGAYEMSEMILQQLLADAGFSGFRDDLVTVQPEGTEVAAESSTLESGETYTGYEQAEGFSSPGGAVLNKPRTYTVPSRLNLNDRALAGLLPILTANSRMSTLECISPICKQMVTYSTGPLGVVYPRSADGGDGRVTMLDTRLSIWNSLTIKAVGRVCNDRNI